MRTVKLLADVALVVTMHGRYDVKPGERIALAPNPACVHLFDASSGQRL